MRLRECQESLEIRRAINDKNGVAASEQALGESNYSLGDYEKALQHFMEALAVATEIDNKWSLISAMLSIGDIYTETNQYGDVLRYLKGALEMAAYPSIERCAEDGEALGIGY